MLSVISRFSKSKPSLGGGGGREENLTPGEFGWMAEGMRT